MNPDESILHAVFDASFAGYRPTSTGHELQYLENLRDIEGMQDLNTDSVTDMSNMFKDCTALKGTNAEYDASQKRASRWPTPPRATSPVKTRRAGD